MLLIIIIIITTSITNIIIIISNSYNKWLSIDMGQNHMSLKLHGWQRFCMTPSGQDRFKGHFMGMLKMTNIVTLTEWGQPAWKQPRK